MSELTLLVLQLGFLAAALGLHLRDRLRAAQRPVRPAGAQAAAGCRSGRAAAAPAAAPRSPQRPRWRPPRAAPVAGPAPAAARRRPIGELAIERERDAPRHHERHEGRRRVPARPRRDHDRPLERLGPHHPRRLHLDPPRAPHAVERPLDDPGPRLHERHLPRRLPSDRADARSRSEPPSRSERRRSSCGGSRWRTIKASAAVSHVGRIRSNNQDSGYAGRHLFVVADGMGGHAGGDVASAIATQRIAEADRRLRHHAPRPRHALEGALIAGEPAARRDRRRPLRAHRHGHDRERHARSSATASSSRTSATPASTCCASASSARSPPTTPSCSASSTPAASPPRRRMVHPRRSVLMRVLGDVEASPEIDTHDARHPRPATAGCSAPTASRASSSFDEHPRALMSADAGAKQVADRLVKASLDGGAPDNVTVVIVDIGEPRRARRPRRSSSARPRPRSAFGAAAEPARAPRHPPARRSGRTRCRRRTSSPTPRTSSTRSSRRTRAGAAAARWMWSFWIVLLIGAIVGGLRARLPVDADPLLRRRVQRPRRHLPGHPAGPRADLAARAVRPRPTHRRRRPPHLRPAAGRADDQRRLARRGRSASSQRLEESVE